MLIHSIITSGSSHNELLITGLQAFAVLYSMPECTPLLPAGACLFYGLHFLLLQSECNCLLTNLSLTLDCDLPEGWETVAFFSVPSVPTQCLACSRHSISIYWNEWLNKWTCFDYTSSNKTKDLSSFSSVLWEQMYSSYVTQSLGWVGEQKESPRGCAGRGVSIHKFGFGTGQQHKWEELLSQQVMACRKKMAWR